MGWGKWQLQEAQDVTEFFRLFSSQMDSGALGRPLQKVFMDLFVGNTETRFGEIGTARVEQFVGE
jgi:hypothetical protein